MKGGASPAVTTLKRLLFSYLSSENDLSTFEFYRLLHNVGKVIFRMCCAQADKAQESVLKASTEAE